MSRIYMTVGPPGTGKTTRLVAKAAEAAEAWGGEKVLICSLTKAAAAEVKSRGVPLPKNSVGTIHAHCHRLLGRPEIAEGRVAEFNKSAKDFQISDPTLGRSDQKRSWGDRQYEKYAVLRARLVPRDQWTESVVQFAEAWEEWKDRNDYLDFEDLIERAHWHKTAPGNPWFIYVDEAQDCSASEIALVRHWAQTANVVLYGDTDQAIFSFRGGDPEAIMALNIPPSNRLVLQESHRVPKLVLDRAAEWIKRCSVREDVTYNPRPEDGHCEKLGVGFHEPERLLKKAQQHLDAGKRVMFIASCGFMLDPLIAQMRRLGLPYANPYNPENGKWNPFRGGTGGTSTADRLVAFLNAGKELSGWTLSDLSKWVPLVSKDVLAKGAKTQVETWAEADNPVQPTDDEVMALFKEGECQKALMSAWGDQLDWLVANTIDSKKKSLEYPLKVFEKCGLSGLTEEPRIIVGSIHSTKGGEADAVFLCPSLSLAGYNEYTASKTRDTVIRQFYVGMTRAYEALYLCDARGRLRVEW